MSGAPSTHELHAMTSAQLAARLAAGPVIALVPVGSTEPHGPHLGLGTDVAISRAACVRAIALLAAAGRGGVMAPAVPYGVTECAAGFAGVGVVHAHRGEGGDALAELLGQADRHRRQRRARREVDQRRLGGEHDRGLVAPGVARAALELGRQRAGPTAR